MTTMKSRFPGTCRSCGERFEAGTEINWSREDGATHARQCPKACTTDEETKQYWMPKVVVTPPEKLVPGVYETNGNVYVVKFNKEKTNLYAKRMVEINPDRATESGERIGIDFVYESGAIYNIKLADRMPVERAKELTTLYGRCIACGRYLKAAKSVENGIGPVCIKNFGPVLNPIVETADGRKIVRAA